MRINQLVFPALIIFSAVLRFCVTFPGYPPYHSDEGITYSAAVSMIRNNNLDPLRYDYPSLVPIINKIFYTKIFIPLGWIAYYVNNFSNIVDGMVNMSTSPNDRARILQLDILGNREVNALFWSRAITALFSTGSVLLLYVLASRLLGKKVGILSALFLSVNYRSVLNGGLGLPDTYNAFFLLLSAVANLYYLKKPSGYNLFFASFICGLSISVKYQPFSLLPLIYCVGIAQWGKCKEYRKFIIGFIVNFLFVFFISILVFVILNPYAFIKIEETTEWLLQVSGKYRVNKNFLDFYPYSYLYKFGIGEVASFLCFIGLVFLFRKKFALLYLMLYLGPFFYVTTYYSGAGFYTRNFISITPFILLVSGYGAYSIIYFRKSKSMKLFGFFIVLLVTYASGFYLSPLLTDYRKEWNFVKVGRWMVDNINNTQVSAHSSVPIPQSVARVPFEFSYDFSLEEARESGSKYIAVNFDWATNDFYWWMTLSTSQSLKYWNKPTKELTESFPAKSIYEMNDYSIAKFFKNEYSPESNFMIVKIPERTYKKGDLLVSYNFTDSSYDWRKEPRDFKDQELPLALTPSFFNQLDRWESPAMSVDSDLLIEYSYNNYSENREGFLFVKLFESCTNTSGNFNNIRLSARFPKGVGQGLLPVKIPAGVNCFIVGLQSYTPQTAKIRIESLKIFEAEVAEESGGWKYEKSAIPEGIIFPNSHGNL